MGLDVTGVGAVADLTSTVIVRLWQLLGMLGLGGPRTVEKTEGVA